MKPHLYFTLLLFTTCGSLYAEPNERDPIDIALEKAYKISSTQGLVLANYEAQEKWNKEIDRALTELKKIMTPEQWKALQASQEAWGAYRDKELDTLMEIYGAMPGTGRGPRHTQRKMELTKERALQLRVHVEDVSHAKELREQ